MNLSEPLQIQEKLITYQPMTPPSPPPPPPSLPSPPPFHPVSPLPLCQTMTT